MNILSTLWCHKQVYTQYILTGERERERREREEGRGEKRRKGKIKKKEKIMTLN
jgi:hypothetical protein